jgi:hypothetical protein
MRFSDSHHFRKTVAGCCMVAGPLLVLIGFVLSPAIHTDAAEQVNAFAADRDGTIASALFSLAGIALMVGAVFGVMHMLRERMAAYGPLGGGLAIMGLIAFAAQCGVLILAWQMVADGVQPSDVAAWDGLIGAAAAVIAMQVVAWLGTAGFVVLAAGLYRARAVDWWMAACMAVGVVGIALAGPLGSVGVGIVGSALFLIGFGAIGTMVLRETDAEWEHTPEYGGFRPAMHMR